MMRLGDAVPFNRAHLLSGDAALGLPAQRSPMPEST
jgi:hypothetical protein